MEVKDRQKIFFYDVVSGAGCMTHNGPAVGLSKRYPTQAPITVPIL
jgi:hypothetical protein